MMANISSTNPTTKSMKPMVNSAGNTENKWSAADVIWPGTYFLYKQNISIINPEIMIIQKNQDGVNEKTFSLTRYNTKKNVIEIRNKTLTVINK